MCSLIFVFSAQTQQDRATRENEKKRIHMQEWKNKERQRIKEGKTPFYLKDGTCSLKGFTTVLFFFQ